MTETVNVKVPSEEGWEVSSGPTLRFFCPRDGSAPRLQQHCLVSSGIGFDVHATRSEWRDVPLSGRRRRPR